MRTEGLGKFKKITSSGIEPASFRFVAQFLDYNISRKISDSYLCLEWTSNPLSQCLNRLRRVPASDRAATVIVSWDCGTCRLTV
jgi:hypothetical protein